MTIASFFTLQLHVPARIFNFFFLKFWNLLLLSWYKISWYMIARYDADRAVWIVPTIFWVRKGSWKLMGHPLASLGRGSQKFMEKMSRKMRLNGLKRIPKDFSLNSEAYRGNLISDGCHPLWQILCLRKMKTYGKDRDQTWDHYWVDISCYVPMTLTS